ncbi:MAG: hypothetical protein ACREJQ_01935 [bacterium]
MSKLVQGRSSRGWAALTAAWVLFMGAAASQPASPYLNTDEAANKKTVWFNEAVVPVGISIFSQVEGRAPSSYTALCASPYLPVRCKDLINPYTGKPVEDKADSPGNLHFDPNSTGTSVAITPATNTSPPQPLKVKGTGLKVTFYHTIGGKLGNWFVFYDNNVALQPGYKHKDGAVGMQREWKGHTASDLSAFAVGSYLTEAIQGYYSRTKSWPNSINDIETLNSRQDLFSDWKSENQLVKSISNLRNDWTGGKAAAGTGPGDYNYGHNADGNPMLQIFGDGGVILYQATFGVFLDPVKFGNSFIVTQTAAAQ